MLEHVLQLIIITALFNFGIYMLLDKWGFIQWLQLHVDEFVWPSQCQFCFFWRLTVLQMLAGHLVCIFNGYMLDVVDLFIVYVVITICSAALSRYFLSHA